MWALLWIALALSPIRAGAQTVTLVSQLDPHSGRYGDVWGEGDYAYLGSAASGVAIIDLSDPNAPFLETTYLPEGGERFNDVKVHGGIGYFASDNGGGLHIVDLSDPTSPTLISQVTSADSGYDSIHNVFYADGFLYEADSRTPVVKVFDVLDPNNPSFVRDITTPALLVHDVTVVGSRLYASGWSDGVFVYDVSGVGVGAPPLIGSVTSGANSHSSWATSDGQTLIVAREESGGDVRIFDISDPNSAVLLSTLSPEALGISAFSPHNPFLFSNDLLFVSWYQAGLQVIDISDPSNPFRIGHYDTFPGAVSGFDGNWGVYPLLGLDRVLLSDTVGGLFIVDASGLKASPVPVLGPGSLSLRALALRAAALSCARRVRLQATAAPRAREAQVPNVSL
jgi:choice-of-anchor B domain-containing protein